MLKAKREKKKFKNLNAVKRSRLRTDFGNIKVIDDSSAISFSSGAQSHLDVGSRTNGRKENFDYR